MSDGAVLVSAPRGMSKSTIESFLYSKNNWIKKNVAKQRAMMSEYDGIAENEVLLFGEIITLPEKYIGKRVSFYRAQSVYLARRIAEIAEKYCYTYTGLRFSRARTRWGSCNGNNGITLNLALLTVPERLSDYVIVHELCHTVQHDHSAAFWKRVERVLPDYAVLRKELKKYTYTLKFLNE